MSELSFAMDLILITIVLSFLALIIVMATANDIDRYRNKVKSAAPITAPAPNYYQDYKKRLQDEIRYAKMNPWRKDATVLRFPIERTRRPK